MGFLKPFSSKRLPAVQQLSNVWGQHHGKGIEEPPAKSPLANFGSCLGIWGLSMLKVRLLELLGFMQLAVCSELAFVLLK